MKRQDKQAIKGMIKLYTRMGKTERAAGRDRLASLCEEEAEYYKDILEADEYPKKR